MKVYYKSLTIHIMNIKDLMDNMLITQPSLSKPISVLPRGLYMQLGGILEINSSIGLKFSCRGFIEA